ncbi:interleukin-17 receptor B isoform X2 [Heptranchias perlo]|uniref:interleukin-17 receptor B isoform X2 n=1 Tax=Heptranchias perlo TaxID=212740 RepID=UPI00355AC25A
MKTSRVSFILLYFAVLGMVTDSVSITCVRKHSSEPPPEWTISHEKTPSDISKLKVQLMLSEENQLPVLDISWVISPDASIQELRATMICIRSQREFCVRCEYNAPFKSERNPQDQPWQFHYTEYPVDPFTHYYVKAFNIPTSNIGESPPEKSTHFSAGCDDVAMKNHQSCEEALWNPNISLSMVNNDVVINFTTSATSSSYDVELIECNLESTILNSTTILQSNGSRISITFVRNDVLDLSEQFCVRIKPYFSVCKHYCLKHEKVLNISKPKDKISNNFTGDWEEPSNGKVNERIILTTDAQLLQPVKVLLIYSMDNELFQNVVLTFAEFLQSFSGIQVIVDMWQKRNIAEMGPVQWLASQRETADKVIIVCSKGAKMKWDAICCKTNIYQIMNNSEDMYSTALNIFCSDMQNGSNLHKYIVVYFDKISSAKDIPSIFSSCVKYCLGKDINKFYKNLQDASSKTPNECCIRLSNYNYKSLYCHKMKNAILEFKESLNIHPTSSNFIQYSSNIYHT